MPNVRGAVSPFETNFPTIAGDQGSRRRSGVARQNLADLLNKAFGTITGNNDMTSPNHTALTNLLLKTSQKAQQMATLNPVLWDGLQPPDFVADGAKAIKHGAKKAWIWGTNSEKNAAPLSAALDAADYPPPPPPTPFDPRSVLGPNASAAGGASATDPRELLSIPYTPGIKPPLVEPFKSAMPPDPRAIPAAPQLQPFVVPQAPQRTPFLQAPPPMPMQAPRPTPGVAPDYTAFEDFMKQAQPKASTVDWQRQKKLEALAAMGHNVAQWDPRSGWGGLLAGAADGVSSGVVANSHNKATADDAYQAAMRDFAMRRAQFAQSHAGDQANLINANNNAMDNWKTGNVNSDNKFAIDKYNTEVNNNQNIHSTDEANAQTNYGTTVDNLKNVTDTQNTNLANKHNTDVVQTQQDNQTAQQKYEAEAANLKEIHDATMANAKNMYDYAVNEQQRSMPQVQSADTNGATVLSVENGKQKLTYHPFKDFGNSTHIEDLRKHYGKAEDGGDVPQVKLAIIHDQMASGDVLSVSRAMLEDAVSGAYAKQIFGDKFDQADAAVKESLPAQMGTKEFTEAYPKAMAAQLLGSLDLTNKEQLQALASMGSIQAQYMLSGAGK